VNVGATQALPAPRHGAGASAGRERRAVWIAGDDLQAGAELPLRELPRCGDLEVVALIELERSPRIERIEWQAWVIGALRLRQRVRQQREPRPDVALDAELDAVAAGAPEVLAVHREPELLLEQQLERRSEAAEFGSGRSLPGAGPRTSTP